MTVFFIGAGPGDPELVTVKGQRLIRQCPVVIYAGSLVPQALVAQAHPEALVIDSASLTLEQILDHLTTAHQGGLDVARVHSGDPSLYGAIGEQMRRLEALDIPFEVVPGVSAVSASAAALKRELTLPGVAQTVILTRYPGKTQLPPGEALADLARHGATLAIHLGVTRIHRIVEDLIPHYGTDCPVAVLYRTSWPDADGVEGTLGDIVAKVRAKGFNRTALILVGRVLAPRGGFADSHLYRADKAHRFRPAYGRAKAEPSPGADSN